MNNFFLVSKHIISIVTMYTLPHTTLYVHSCAHAIKAVHQFHHKIVPAVYNSILILLDY